MKKITELWWKTRAMNATINLGACPCGATHQYIDPELYDLHLHPEGSGELIVRAYDGEFVETGEAWDKCPDCGRRLET